MRYIFTGDHPAVPALLEDVRAAGHEAEWLREYSDEAARVLGGFDGLIVCDRPVARADLRDPSDYETVVENAERDIMAAYDACRFFGTRMAARGRGAIVFLSSIHADKPNGAAPGYSIGEGAKQMMMRELALHLGNLGVRVNTIKLAPAESEAEDFIGENIAVNYDVQTKSPIHRYVRPSDASGLLLLLLSDAASAINGADIRVDGGQTLYYYDRKFKAEVSE